MSKNAFASATTLALKHSQERRGSELQAGARAELSPTTLTVALSSLAGRLSARTMIKLFGKPNNLNFLTARIPLLAEVIKRSIAPMTFSPLIVDLNAGFSPLGVTLATDMPSARVIELDTPEVIKEREQRLSRARSIMMPPNLATIATDLETTPLIRALLGQQADVITFTGGYMTAHELQSALLVLQNTLTALGSCVVYLPWRDGLEEMRESTRLFKRQVGELPGTMDSENAIHDLFRAAGYPNVRLYYPSQLARELGLPTPILNVEVLAVARKR